MSITSQMNLSVDSVLSASVHTYESSFPFSSDAGDVIWVTSDYELIPL